MNGLILPDTMGRWQHRAVAATEGNKSLLGCFVLAVLGWQHGRKPPRFGNVARIDAGGLVFSNMQNADGKIFTAHCLGPVQDIIDNFRGLADHLKLTDAERVEMFSELSRWFVYDARADQSTDERGLMQ